MLTGLLALLIVLGTGATASAAVAMDGVVTSSSLTANSATWSKTILAGSNRLLLVGICIQGTTRTVSSVTYGGVALTKVIGYANTDSVEIWRLVAPVSGSANVVVNLSGSTNFTAVAVSFTGVDQGAPLGAPRTGVGTSTTPSASAYSRVNDLVFDVMTTQDSGSPAEGGSQTRLFALGSVRSSAVSTQAGAAANVTNSWTTANKHWVDVVLNIRAASATPGEFLTGTYTGDGGATQAISGQPGFEPDVVFVKGETTQEGVVHTATMNGDESKEMTTAPGLLPSNLIKSLDAAAGAGASGGGFTVGNDARVNSNTIVYDYVALTANAGEVFVGAYLGNGGTAWSITGVGFQPDAVMLFVNGAYLATFSTSSMAAGTSVQFDASASVANCITAFQSDGFQVGTNLQCNGSLFTVHYIAFKNGSRFKAGSYTGDNTATQAVTVSSGGTPDWVIVRPTTSVAAVQKMSVTGQAVDTGCFFRNIACSAGTITDLHSNGFNVGNSGTYSYNASSTTYHYMAFSHRAAVTAVTLASFQATRSADQGTLLQWRTGYEANNLGFNLYREELGVRVRVNPSLIGGSALMGGPGTPMKAGFSYAWVDRTPIDPNATVTYWLEDVDLNGTRTLHGPIAGVAATWKAPKIGQAPLLKHLGKPADPKPTAEGSELYYNP